MKNKEIGLWTHKDIDIKINNEGLFEYDYQHVHHKAETLDGAIKDIDEIVKSYYTITKQDYKTLLSKLNDREKHLMKSIIEELGIHADSAYCELGLGLDFDLNQILN